MIKEMRLFQRNGKFYVEFGRGKKRSLKTGDKRKAEALFREMEREQLRGRLIQLDDGSRKQIEDFRADYVADRVGLGRETIRMDDLALRKLAEAIGGKTVLAAIDSKKIERFKSVCDANGLSYFSINTYLRHIKAALNYAVDIGLIKKAPKIKMVKTSRHFPRILTPEEIAAIRMVSSETDPELNRIIEFALWTGCRRSEILSARWQNISGNAIRIIGKGDKERIVPLVGGAVDAIGERKDIGPIFVQWHKDTISKRFKKISRAAGIDDIHFHNLRHSAATYMLKNGIGLPVVQKILGHTDIRTTQIYAQVLSETLFSEMERFRI